MSFGNLSWENVQDSSKGDLTPIMKIEAGKENRCRVVSAPFESDNHWEETVDGGKKKIICPGVGCPICAAGHIPTHRYQILVLNRATNQVEVLEFGKSILTQIAKYAKDDEYGDPKNYDIKILKSGSGRDTKYEVVPSPKQIPLSSIEMDLVNSAKPLTEINKTKTSEEILQLNLKVFAEDMQSQADDWNNDNTGDKQTTDDWDNI